MTMDHDTAMGMPDGPRALEPHEIAEGHFRELLEQLSGELARAEKEEAMLAEERDLTNEKLARRQRAIEQRIEMCRAAISTQEKAMPMRAVER